MNDVLYKITTNGLGKIYFEDANDHVLAETDVVEDDEQLAVWVATVAEDVIRSYPTIIA